MSPQFSDDWPGGEHRINCPPDHVHAIGMIALNFNLLEGAIRMLLEQVLTLPSEPSRKIIRDMSNRERVDTLRLMLETFKEDQQSKEAVSAALVAFDICAENRNILIHASHWDSNEQTGITAFYKMASGGPLRELFYTVDLTTLREVADAIHATDRFIMAIWRHLEAKNPSPPPEQGGQKSWWFYVPLPPAPLPKTPPRPRKLSPSQPPAIPQDEAPQPQS